MDGRVKIIGAWRLRLMLCLVRRVLHALDWCVTDQLRLNCTLLILHKLENCCVTHHKTNLAMDSLDTVVSHLC